MAYKPAPLYQVTVEYLGYHPPRSEVWHVARVPQADELICTMDQCWRVRETLLLLDPTPGTPVAILRVAA